MAFGTDTPYPAFQAAAFPKLISLDAARANPGIVYHSVKHLDRAPIQLVTKPRPAVQQAAPKAVLTPRFQPPVGFTLIPLRVAAARNDIKYRKEGFELRERQEQRRHIQAVREDPF